MKLISVPVFLISFAIGMLVVYITGPSPREIMVYPTPDNIDKLLYRDRADQCFEFEHKEIPCPKDKNHIHKIPVQNPHKSE